MSKRLVEMHDQIVKLNKYLDNKVFSQEDILENKETLNDYFKTIDNVEKLLDELKNTSPDDQLKYDSTTLSNLCSNIGLMTCHLYNLKDDIEKILQKASIKKR